MTEKKHDKYAADFQQFMENQPLEPPTATKLALREKISSLLQPGLTLILFKMGLVQLFVGTATLIACPQFGVQIVAKHGIFHWIFMISPYLCMIACGVFFSGTSALLAPFALSLDEMRVARQRRLVIFPLLSGVSLVALHLVGGKVMLSMGSIWLLAAVGSGMLLFEIGHRFRLASLSLSPQ